MIIKKGTKYPETMSGKPNHNWTGDDSYFVVDDNSALGEKILSNAPFYEEIKDGSGRLIDIVPTERPPQPPPEPDPLTLLQLAQAEMFEQYQLERQLDQLAMAEMFEMMMGGNM